MTTSASTGRFLAQEHPVEADVVIGLHRVLLCKEAACLLAGLVH
jgi:hypothetical protein